MVVKTSAELAYVPTAFFEFLIWCYVQVFKNSPFFHQVQVSLLLISALTSLVIPTTMDH